MRNKTNVHRLWVGKPGRKRPLGKPRCRLADNIMMDLREMGWYELDCSCSGYGPVEGSCEHGKEFSGSIKYWEVIE
jgi:hypothetical protein